MHINLYRSLSQASSYKRSESFCYDENRARLLIGGNASVVSPASSTGGTHSVSRRNHCGEFALRAFAGVDFDSSDFVRIQMATHYCSFQPRQQCSFGLQVRFG